LFKPATMDAFELEYDFVHVRAFTYILSGVLDRISIAPYGLNM